jgi:hypothetical protein
LINRYKVVSNFLDAETTLTPGKINDLAPHLDIEPWQETLCPKIPLLVQRYFANTPDQQLVKDFWNASGIFLGEIATEGEDTAGNQSVGFWSLPKEALDIIAEYVLHIEGRGYLQSGSNALRIEDMTDVAVAGADGAADAIDG